MEGNAHVHGAAARLKEDARKRTRVVFAMPAYVFFEMDAGVAGFREKEAVRCAAEAAADSVREMFRRCHGVIDLNGVFPGADAAYVVIQGAEAAGEDGGEALMGLIEPYIVRYDSDE